MFWGDIMNVQFKTKYNGNEIEIKEYLPSSEWIKNKELLKLKCPYTMENPKGICIHNTSNSATALNEIKYMETNNTSTSFHFAVDDKEIYSGVPINRNAFHAGDGGNGDGNRNYISIEICKSLKDIDIEKFKKAEKLSAWLVANLMLLYGFDFKDIRTHQSFSGKYCPHRTLDLGWDRYINIVREELNKMTFEKRYNTLEEVPEFAYNTVSKLIDKGLLNGDSNGLDLDYDMLRLLVINDRGGLYDK